MKYLDGNKTYVVCILMLVIASFGYYKGLFTFDQFFQLIGTASIGGGLRSAINKV